MSLLNKRPSISLNWLRNVKFNSAGLFYIILAGILLLEAMVIKDTVTLVLRLEGQQPPVAANTKGVRINFEDYNKIVEKIEKAKSFRPNNNLEKNPFRPQSKQ